MPREPSAFAKHWTLDPDVLFLNHGSFGACPRTVLGVQAELRARLEREPVAFFVRELEPMLDAARAELAVLLDVPPDELAFVQNATQGVNCVLHSLRLAPGDELLTTDHAYRACKNALDQYAHESGVRVVVAETPFPLRSEDDVVDALLARVSERTRLALVDHVTSPTAIVFPIARIVRELAARGVDCLVDGAHAPGTVDVSVSKLGAAYYTGNCHKWLCAPKSVGFLHVPRARQAQIRPLCISHGASSTRADRSRFLCEFDWVGTTDPTPALCVPAAIRALSAMLPGGLPAVRAHNHELALFARDRLCEALAIEPPVPDAMLGSMAAVPLPVFRNVAPSSHPFVDPVQDWLFKRHRIEVPVQTWPPGGSQRVLRISAQLYNHESDYETLATALRELAAFTPPPAIERAQ